MSGVRDAPSKDIWVCVPTSARVCDDVHNPCHHQGPHKCLGSELLCVTMVVTEGLAVAKGGMIWVACIATSDLGVTWTQAAAGGHI